MASKIDPKKIRMEADTQSRVEINQDVVDDYVEAMQRGVEFPPILVYYDEAGDLFILVDGFHRFLAHLKLRPNDWIMAEQRIGTLEDARWDSFAANQSHGLRRTNADKRRAVEGALMHPKGATLSDNQIAKHVGVSHTTVQNVRRELELSCKICKIESREVRRGDQVYTQNTVRIGDKTVRCSDTRRLFCGHCQHHRENQCELTDEECPPYQPACEEFLEEPAPDPVLILPECDPDKVELLDELPGKKSKKRNLHSYKGRGYLNVSLPPDNPQLFACELRHYFERDYLIECLAALKRTLIEADQDDPFPCQ